MHAHRAGVLLFLAASLSAQLVPAVRVDGADGALARAVAVAAAKARAEAPGRGRALAMHVLACLRLGDVAASGEALAAAARADAAADAGADDDAWWLAAQLWHVRASGDRELPARRWQALQAAARRVVAAPPQPSFAAESLRVHALLCFGALAAARDAEPPTRAGGIWTERAIGAQIELERRFWLPDRDRFAGTAAGAAIADASLLLPASAGLLLATGDRLPRHLARTLDELERAGGSTAEGAALQLATAAQLTDDGARARAWTHLLAALDGGDGDVPAGLVVDALLFAATGVRVATGAGVDEGWLRCAPWLPPGHERLAVRGVRANGCRFDLELTARSGPARADEADASAHFGGDGARLHVRFVLAATADGEPRPVLVAGPAVQTVQWLRPGDAFVCSLPRVQPQAQHDARALRGAQPGAETVGAGAR